MGDFPKMPGSKVNSFRTVSANLKHMVLYLDQSLDKDMANKMLEVADFIESSFGKGRISPPFRDKNIYDILQNLEQRLAELESKQ